jgi:hypothetical protein
VHGVSANESKEWPQHCRCGESWDASQWADLPSDGRYFAGRDGWIELRMCVCGARLSVPCEPPATR